MCAIVGFYSEDKSLKQIALLTKIMEESSIRGLHSFGIAYNSKRGIKIHKTFDLKINNFISHFWDNGGKRLIFHCRYSTSGDFQDMKNNMPIRAYRTALVLNGVISMEEKHIFEKQFNVKCRTANDAEIILRHKRYIDFLIDNPDASFAGLFLRKNKLIALRNNKRPLYYFTAYGAKYFVSTIDIAVRSGVSMDRIKSVPVLQYGIA
jgi:glutamine phosphoribosylpyrophosphate amidotransferase